LIKSFFGSLVGKFTAVALLVAGVAGGMAATGALPGFGNPSTYSVASVTSTHFAPGVDLSFPTEVIEGHAVVPAIPEEIVEEVVVIASPRKVSAPAPAAPAAPAAPKCVGDITTAVGAITSVLNTLTTPEQGQVVLAQANALTAAATSCVAEAGQIGFAATDVLNGLVAQTSGLLTQVQALPIVAALTPAQVADSSNVVGGVVGGVTDVVAGTLNVVGQGLGLLGTGLNFLGNAGK
jgi:hypothetical protein